MKKNTALLVAIGSALATVGSSAFAALDATAVTAVQTAVTTDTATASAAGFAVMTVVLGTSIGFGLLSKFINKGAKG